LAKRLVKYLNINIDVVWSFDPYRFQSFENFDNSFKIYHAADVHKIEYEKLIASNSNLVVAPSYEIVKRLSKYNKNTIKINHGITDDYFETSRELVNLNKGNKIAIGILGNFNYPYLDAKTLYRTVKYCGNYNFYFIGPIEKSNISNIKPNYELYNKLNKLINFKFIGEIDSIKLPSFLSNFDGFVMCYDSKKYSIETSNSHKIMQFLSTGKIIVSHYVSEYSNTNLFVMVQNNINFPLITDSVFSNIEYHNCSKFRNQRISYAKNNIYSTLIKSIDNYIFNNYAN